MTINSDGDLTIDQLIAAGRHAEAAKRALDGGEPARAADLFEKLWDFRSALEAARAAGDLARALRYAAELGAEPETSTLIGELAATDDGARAALDVLVRMRRHADAAPIAERLGETTRAIDLYTRAHQDLDAARLLEAQGLDRDAGRLLERALELATGGNEKAPLQLALGRILAHRGAYPEATRLLQEARRYPELRAEAQRHLVATLAAMGLRDGARDALLELRALELARGTEISADLDTYLRTWRDQTADRKTSRDREVIAGRYRLERLLGAGASGRVFLATDEVAGRSVALKMFFASSARGGAAYERFVREARLASTLRHPSLVEVYDVSVERGFLVMEYLPGGSLAQRLASGERLAGAQVRRMALDIIGGLEAAHHRGVVHRDVKPANVFFDARGTAKLGDFGVAHLVDLGQTQTGGLIGTLAYMSPEQITGAPISIAADLYALGVTLFEALTARLPFLGPDFVAQHLGETPPRVSTVGEGVDQTALPFGTAAGRAQGPAVDQTALPFGTAAGRAQGPAVDQTALPFGTAAGRAQGPAVDQTALPFGTAAGRAQGPAVDQTALPFGTAAGRAQGPAVDQTALPFGTAAGRAQGPAVDQTALPFGTAAGRAQGPAVDQTALPFGTAAGRAQGPAVDQTVLPFGTAAGRAQGPAVEASWDPLIAELLVKNPRERMQTLGDLRRALEALDLGGRPQIGPRSKRATAPHASGAQPRSPGAQPAEEEVGPRYQYETPLGTTPHSQLARAVDTVLDRSVVIERFDASDEATRALDHARLLGRAQSPFVQRALGLDRTARTAVFEAPSGASLADAKPQLPPAEAVRLLKRLARAAAAIHELGGSHGLIGPRTIVLDDGAVPTLLAAGLGSVVDARPEDDVAAVIGIVASIVGSESTFGSLASTVCGHAGATVPRYEAPVDGETLYAAADAVDIAVLGALGSK